MLPVWFSNDRCLHKIDMHMVEEGYCVDNELIIAADCGYLCPIIDRFMTGFVQEHMISNTYVSS